VLITTVLADAKKKRLAPLQRRVLNYIEAHDGEVFAYRDNDLASALGIKPAALGFSLWALEKAGLISKESASGKVYFGSQISIRRLREGLGLRQPDAFERALANAEKIRARVGNLDNRAALDEIRGGPLPA
jgi:hypothetical protein